MNALYLKKYAMCLTATLSDSNQISTILINSLQKITKVFPGDLIIMIFLCDDKDVNKISSLTDFLNFLYFFLSELKTKYIENIGLGDLQWVFLITSVSSFAKKSLPVDLLELIAQRLCKNPFSFIFVSSKPFRPKIYWKYLLGLGVRNESRQG